MSIQLQLKAINKQFSDGSEVISNLNLTVEKGAFHFLLGPSGSGKTTLLRMIAGLDKVTSGGIYFNGEEVTHTSAAQRGIGMVFQNYALWPHMTVYDNVAYPLKVHQLGKAQIAERAEQVLNMTQLSDLKNRYPSELSGGQQQRVAVARALGIKPKVLLFDEPLSNLDAKLRTSMRDSLIRLHKKIKVTTIYVTHDQKEALSMASQVTVINKGREVQTGTPRELYLQPKSIFLASFIGDTNLIHNGLIRSVKENHTAIVDTASGAIQAELNTDRWQKGDKVCLSIRPESIKIDLGKHELANRMNVITGKLIQTIYLGEVDQLHLLLKDGNILKISLFNAPDYNMSIGSVVKCFFKPNKVVVLPTESILA
ncbi:MAG: ABC transporter ATP-binding protein [Bacteroidota bacterium]